MDLKISVINIWNSTRPYETLSLFVIPNPRISRAGELLSVPIEVKSARLGPFGYAQGKRRPLQTKYPYRARPLAAALCFFSRALRKPVDAAKKQHHGANQPRIPGREAHHPQHHNIADRHLQ